jgi:hypothetical protein
VTQQAPGRARATSVFVNCPRDEAFRPLYEAMLLTCIHAGFLPVIAESSGRAGESRLDRILGELASCRYSIHDLSRSRGEGDENLARFNMPLELGMAMGLQAWQPEEDRHEYLMLVPEGLMYRRYISDLAGFDPAQHDGTPQRVVGEVLSWLVASPDAPAPVKPPEVIAKLDAFRDALAGVDADWQGGTPPWGEIVHAAVGVVRGSAR